MQPPSKGGKIFYMFRPDHMTLMAAMFILYGKIIEKSSSLEPLGQLL